MEAEIAELESFIDSYVGDDADSHIQSEVFTNTSAKQQQGLNAYEFYDKDFEEELREHQNQQESYANSYPEGYLTDNNWNPHEPNPFANMNPPPSSLCQFQETEPYLEWSQPSVPYYPYPYDHQNSEGLPAALFPPYQYPIDTAHTTSQNQEHQPTRPTQNITNNDLRHRINSKRTNKSVEKAPDKKQLARTNSKGKTKESLPRVSDDKNWGKSNASRDPDRGATNGKRHNSSVVKDESTKATHDMKLNQKSLSRHSSQSSSSESTNLQGNSVVSGRSKAEVLSWLRHDSKMNATMERQMKNLELSRKKDLPKLIKSAQSFIKNEAKMREVAEMICAKGMKSSSAAESGAVLCNELSQRMVNGTSFRTVVLNIVQGHFKNRHQLIAKAVKEPHDGTWCGFVTFLVELYLELRTSSNERLKALVNPVYDCLFLILQEKNMNYEISKCFLDNIQKVGIMLQKSNPQRMTELISQLRDNCVLSSDLSINARRNLLQSLEYYARGWKCNVLDKPYYDGCS